MVLAGAWGWSPLTEPFPATRRTAALHGPTSPPATEVFRDQVTVSVLQRAATATAWPAATLEQLGEARLRRRRHRQRPEGPVASAQIWAARPEEPRRAAGQAPVRRRPRWWPHRGRRGAAGARGRRRPATASRPCAPRRSSPSRPREPTRRSAARRRPERSVPLVTTPRLARATARAGRRPRPGAAAASVSSRALRGVTTSRSSPWRRTVRRSGTSISPSRITSDTEAPCGSRSSPTSTPCIRETGLIATCSRSAATRSSGAASTSRPRGSELPGDPEQADDPRQRRTGEQGVDHHHHEDDVEEVAPPRRPPRPAGSW